MHFPAVRSARFRRQQSRDPKDNPPSTNSSFLPLGSKYQEGGDGNCEATDDNRPQVAEMPAAAQRNAGEVASAPWSGLVVGRRKELRANSSVFFQGVCATSSGASWRRNVRCRPGASSLYRSPVRRGEVSKAGSRGCLGVRTLNLPKSVDPIVTADARVSRLQPECASCTRRQQSQLGD